MRPARAIRVLAVACAVPLFLTTLASPATAADSWAVPRQAWITIKGHGYGHGHGMSQYGAEGAARQGKSFRQIADFYYPGTTWGTARGSVRVLISADTTDDVVVLARDGLRVRDSRTGTVTRLPTNGATRWRIVVNSAGEDRISYLTDRWRPWRGLEGEGAFSAGGAPVTLVTPSGQRRYRGRLAAHAPSAGSRARNTINTLSLENYLKGVVPLEMPALWSKAAVRAQAVAARTYAAYERDHRTGPLCDTTSCQVYGGYDQRAPGVQRRGRRHRPPRPDAQGCACVHAVLLQQRRLDVRRIDALPHRQGGPVRRLGRQPGALVVGAGQRRAHRGQVARHRQPDTGSRSPSATGTVSGAAASSS